MTFTEVRDLSTEGSFTTVGEVYPRDVDGDGDVDIQVSGEDANGPVIVNFINYRITQCNDGNDNDADGLIDLNDFGCTSSNDNDESEPAQAPECADGIDNDGDGAVDTNDSACFLPSNGSESADSCGNKTNIATVEAGSFTMNSVGETNEFSLSCNGAGFLMNTAEKMVSFTVEQRSKVEISANANTADFDPYIYVLSASGCNSGEVLACDNNGTGGYTISMDDVAPGTYFLALSSNSVFNVEEGSATVNLSITPINPTTLVATGDLCE
jgi:hypothetical protein